MRAQATRRGVCGLVLLLAAGCLPNAKDDPDTLMAIGRLADMPSKARLLGERINRDLVRALEAKGQTPESEGVTAFAYALIDPRERVVLYPVGMVLVGVSDVSLRNANSAVVLIQVGTKEDAAVPHQTWYLWRSGMWIDQGTISEKDGFDRGMSQWRKKATTLPFNPG